MHTFKYVFESQTTSEEIRVPSNYHLCLFPFTPFRDLEQLEEWFQREKQKGVNPALWRLFLVAVFYLGAFTPSAPLSAPSILSGF